MLSLAYRISTMRIGYTGTRRPAVESLTLRSKAAIRDVPRIELTNVFNYVDGLIQEGTKIAVSNVPNWAPPFPGFFTEWHMDKNSQLGAMVMAGPPDNSPPSLQKLRPDAKWLIMVVGFFAGPLSRGLPIMLQNVAYLLADGSGKCPAFSMSDIEEDAETAIGTILATVGFGISFMHCKNVRQVEAKDDAGDRWHRQYKIPRYTYRTLVIDPMKEVLRREGKSEETGLKRALHICRGHFASYSDEKPMFGKYPGTFWIPDHVRGSKEHGEVVKTYDVKPAASHE